VIGLSDKMTLLEQVRVKEIELADRYTQACAEAEAAKEAAVREGRALIEVADREGHEAAEMRYRAAMAALDEEIERMRRDSVENETALRSGVEARIAEATAELVMLVAPGS